MIITIIIWTYCAVIPMKSMSEEGHGLEITHCQGVELEAYQKYVEMNIISVT